MLVVVNNGTRKHCIRKQHSLSSNHTCESWHEGIPVRTGKPCFHQQLAFPLGGWHRVTATISWVCSHYFSLLWTSNLYIENLNILYLAWSNVIFITFSHYAIPSNRVLTVQQSMWSVDRQHKLNCHNWLLSNMLECYTSGIFHSFPFYFFLYKHSFFFSIVCQCHIYIFDNVYCTPKYC